MGRGNVGAFGTIRDLSTLFMKQTEIFIILLPLPTDDTSVFVEPYMNMPVWIATIADDKGTCSGFVYKQPHDEKDGSSIIDIKNSFIVAMNSSREMSIKTQLALLEVDDSDVDCLVEISYKDVTLSIPKIKELVNSKKKETIAKTGIYYAIAVKYEQYTYPVYQKLIPIDGFHSLNKRSLVLFSDIDMNKEINSTLLFLDKFHKNNWYHNDIKINNMLLRPLVGDTYTLCLCDYGAFVNNNELYMMSTFPCPMLFIAYPDIFDPPVVDMESGLDRYLKSVKRYFDNMDIDWEDIWEQCISIYSGIKLKPFDDIANYVFTYNDRYGLGIAMLTLIATKIKYNASIIIEKDMVRQLLCPPLLPKN